jgi:hypothetical protein
MSRAAGLFGVSSEIAIAVGGIAESRVDARANGIAWSVFQFDGFPSLT